ncbi:MAG: hypothetical protein KC591_03540, partial [Gemmatimonadetes bacterium]|nr:hypothetical protein [Gemmatimonadota bacterium]
MSQGGSLRDRARGFARVLLLGVLALGVASARAAAGEKDWTDTAPADLSGYSLERIRFTGPGDVPENELRDEIESSTSGWLRFRPIDLDTLHSDVDRVRLVLRRHGYWSADVRLSLRYDPRDRRVEATFEIEPGVQR